MFMEKFDKYACIGDSISVQVNDVTVTATIEQDTDAHIDDDDTHNIDQSVTGCDDAQHEKLMSARQDWKNDEWFYCGIVLTAEHENGIDLDDAMSSLWGIECNYPGSTNSYLDDVANELLPEILAQCSDIIADHDAQVIDRALNHFRQIMADSNADLADQCAISEAWSNYTDALCKEGELSATGYHECPGVTAHPFTYADQITLDQ